MRALFLSMATVLAPLSRDSAYVEAVQWIGQLGADLAAQHDVQVVFNRDSDALYPIVAAEILLAALGTRHTEIAGAAELAGPIATYVHEHDVTDFVVLESSRAEPDGSLADNTILCDPSRGDEDRALVEIREWLTGSARERSAVLTALLPATPPPSAVERRRTLLPPGKPERVIAIVAALVPEFELVRLETTGDLTVSIGKRTPGIDWRELQVGQRVECDIEGEYATRVVRARLLPPEKAAADGSDNYEGPTP
ncbi:MAG: hypothetical protein DI603_12600 [Roseateles depolymerans]|uniref:Uncharacterized protein n=1 Tax=Roseateles depolymerans TaxID=76731 RepID=A0A2W5DH61_9BURK|nr:MAG: hypothetical protein DI603_12600 [Roseateles depolymerans]